MDIKIKYLFYNEYKEDNISFMQINDEMIKNMIIC